MSVAASVLTVDCHMSVAVSVLTVGCHMSVAVSVLVSKMPANRAQHCDHVM